MACFIAFIIGMPPLLVFGLLLKKLAHLFHWQRAWEWMLIGAVLTILFSASATLLPRNKDFFFLFDSRTFLQQLFALGGGDGIPLQSGRSLNEVLTILAGVATSCVLFRIDRAFSGEKMRLVNP